MFFNKKFNDKNLIAINSVKNLKDKWTNKTLLRKILGKNFINICVKIDELLSYIKSCYSFLVFKKISLPYLEVVLNTKCTLNCYECAALIPYFDSNTHYSINFEEYKANLDKLLKFVDNVYLYRILGGEPLLNKDFAKIVDYAASKKQLKDIRIVTNGTMLFSDNVLKMLEKQSKKVSVVISNYSCNKELSHILKHDEIINSLKKHNIRFHLCEGDIKWREMQEIYPRNRSVQENKRIYKNCWMQCVSMMGKEIHICPVSSSLSRLTSFKPNEEEVIKLDELTKENSFEKFKSFYSNEPFSVCDFCQDKTLVPFVPAAVQTTQKRILGVGK